MGKSRNTLIVFTKNPIPGEVKTRIGNIKGHQTAVKIYQRLLEHTESVISGVKAEKIIYFNAKPFITDLWSNDNYQYNLQIQGNLGQKMEAAFEDQFAVSSKVLIIGSDCAELKRSDIEKAFEELDESDIVIGPAKDGGYYLLGMNRLHSFLFEEMPWSKAELFASTIESIKKNNLTFSLLAEKSDIDFWEDWEQLGWSID